ncbi:MAG: helix-turn-helix transcriptional regulator [Burkholderiales bacterium]
MPSTVGLGGARTTGAESSVRAGTRHVTLALPERAVRKTAARAGRDRSVDAEYAVAVPPFVDRDSLVRFPHERAGRGLDARERGLPEAVRGPLPLLDRQARALDHAHAMVARYRSWFEAEGWREVEVDAQCRIRRAGRQALALLGIAVPDAGLRPGATLPPALVAWLTRSPGHGPAGAALTLAAGTRVFALRAMPVLDGGGWLLHVGEKAGTPPAGAGGGGLSAREREVLDWVAAGKTDAQAAAILGISVRTVQKHLEHVYVKLGVEGRTAAVMRARGGR